MAKWSIAPPVTYLALLADDVVGWDLENVECGTATEIQNDHAGHITLRLHLEGDLCFERLDIELREAVDVWSQCCHVVEPCTDRHVASFHCCGGHPGTSGRCLTSL